MAEETGCLDILTDERVNCYSVMVTMSIAEYLTFVERIYEKEEGGLEGQREPLKTRTAIRIRATMRSDLRKGAVLPPIVLGVVVPREQLDSLKTLDLAGLKQMVQQIPIENIFIIDGVQRTTALAELYADPTVDASIVQRPMRVEYWIASQTNSLIYRMLILNTGQVPWNLKRQIEVVFRSMIKEIKQEVTGIELLQVGVPKRRSRAGQFQAKDIVELYLVFGARKAQIDTKERLSEEFTKLDFIEATAQDEFARLFYAVLGFLGQFDKAFGKYEGQAKGDRPRIQQAAGEQENKGRFCAGLDLFNSQPARVGFITAMALEILGRPGSERSPDEQNKKWNALKENATELLGRLQNMTSDGVGEFLDFETLEQSISRRSTRVGEFEREFFTAAFQVLIQERFQIQKMTQCWRAH